MATETLLLVTANQSQAFLQQLTAELRGIRDALYKAHDRNCVDVVEQGSISYASLWDFLNSTAGQTITMLHYIGHSSAQGIFVEGTGDNAIKLSTEALTGLFNRPAQLRFVFLNSCCSETIANSFLQAGVPYVIGTSVSVKDDQAVRVAEKFYKLLGNVHNPLTVAEAFRQTQTLFDNGPQNPIAQPDTSPKRGSIETETEEDRLVFPWQFYQRDDLTDAQRDWRLVPAPADYVTQPDTINECYTLTPPSTAYRSLSFLLSYTPADQTIAKDLIQQIRQTFRPYGLLTISWSDETLTDPIIREQQLTDWIVGLDFVFMLVNEGFLADPFAQRVMTLCQTQAGRLVAPPVVLPTTPCNWPGSTAANFNHFPLSGDPLNAAMLPAFSRELYTQWMKWLRKKPAPGKVI